MATLLVVKSYVDDTGRQGHRLYVGPEDGELQVAGTVFMSNEAWRVLSDAMLAGAKQLSGQLIIALEGDERTRPRDDD